MAQIGFKLTDVHYTGGGIYCYFGQLSDGHYFSYSDCWDNAEILDSDPLETDSDYDYKGYDPEWIAVHTIRFSGTGFCIRIIKQAQKSGKISDLEAQNRIEDLI